MDFGATSTLLREIVEGKDLKRIEKIGEESQASPFIVLRWLSFDPKNLEAISKGSRFISSKADCPSDAFKFLAHSMPKRRYSYIKYLSKPNSKVKKQAAS